LEDASIDASSILSESHVPVIHSAVLFSPFQTPGNHDYYSGITPVASGLPSKESKAKLLTIWNLQREN
jgi:hypothetical protein